MYRSILFGEEEAIESKYIRASKFILDSLRNLRMLLFLEVSEL